MRSRSGNSLSTLMFLVPLLGVPLMAIFGVPQFVPVIASSVQEELSPPAVNRRTHGIGESAAVNSPLLDETLNASSRRNEDRLQDLFRPAVRTRRESRPVRGENSVRETEFVETSLNAEIWPATAAKHERNIETHPQLADLFGSDSPVKPDAASRASSRQRTIHSMPTAGEAVQSDGGLSWREAVQRLNELGIQEFRLEPGRQRGDFYFACEFTPDRDARIMRRFEAEASEPLLAVRAVLQQIDEWLPRR